MDSGVLYISADDKYLTEAKRSAQSVKNQMPDTPTAIITETSSPGGVFDVVIERDDLKSSVVDKSDHIHRTPFDRTLYLDTDTYVTQPLDDIFDVLDHYDIATALEKGEHYDIALPPSVAHRQGGVIAFNNTQAVMELFELWRKIYYRQRQEGHISDQPPLTKAVLESGVSIHTLPVEDNCLIYYGERLEGDVRIVHGHGNLPEYARILNSSSQHRIFSSLFDNKIAFVDSSSLNYLELMYYSLKVDGVRATIERIQKALEQ